jgi:hypothetical protein
MNRHDRRVAAKAAKGQRRKYKKAMGNPQDNGDVLRAIPDDLKADIARSVRSIILGGGNCFYRAVIGMEFLRRLGIPTHLALGGLVYRAGPDPIRDVVSYCGPGNRGQMIGDDCEVSIETWEPGEPQNREFSISEVCGLLWNCEDKMPFRLIEQLDRDIEYDKEYLPITYAAAARRLKRAIDFFKGVSYDGKTVKHRKNNKPRFDGFPYDNYTVGISVAAREVIERVHRLANPQYPDLTAREVVIDTATKEYHNEGMPPWPISRADFTCGDVLLVLLFDLTNQTLACWLASEEEDGKTPTVMVDETDWKFGDAESWSLSSPPSGRCAHTVH